MASIFLSLQRLKSAFIPFMPAINLGVNREFEKRPLFILIALGRGIHALVSAR